MGSLQQKAQMDVLFESVKSLLQERGPGSKLKEMGQVIKELICLMPSKKHMSGRPMGQLEPTLSLSLKGRSC